MPCVEHANVMVSRTAILMRMASAKMVMSMLEQPGTSLMEHHPRLKSAS